ncbi:CAP domain-containing protein [Actinoplanes awajinensis]|uniref:CAP domain-containing protein n=1 Tax=Actinoplanes awajinensis TaxID=135946 RepID=UPI0018DDBA33|nr:CAP domain-containing protein [Actinoplanes awajinensis]
MAQEPPGEVPGVAVAGTPPVPAEDQDPDGYAGEAPEGPEVFDESTPPVAPPVRSPRASPSHEPDPPAESPAEHRTPAREQPVITQDLARAAADPIAASRTAVTAESVSASPLSPVQQQILALVNQQRVKAGCGAVTLDRRLIEAANRHAADMAKRAYFDHASPNGQKAGDRVENSGYHWRFYGENIAKGQDSPWAAMVAWMDSPGHRENILDCKLDQMGIGLALGHDKTPYWVQDFATPQK